MEIEAKYLNNNCCGFIKNHKYTIIITKPKKSYCYLIKAIYDITKQEEVECYINLASEKSIRQNFQIDKSIDIKIDD